MGHGFNGALKKSSGSRHPILRCDRSTGSLLCESYLWEARKVLFPVASCDAACSPVGVAARSVTFPPLFTASEALNETRSLSGYRCYRLLELRRRIPQRMLHIHIPATPPCCFLFFCPDQTQAVAGLFVPDAFSIPTESEWALLNHTGERYSIHLIHHHDITFLHFSKVHAGKRIKLSRVFNLIQLSVKDCVLVWYYTLSYMT